jgi:glycosyltransferase involved in cell wall biosynthesis
MLSQVRWEPLAWRSREAGPWRRLAGEYARLGWHAEAKAAYRRALQFQPGDPTAVAELAELLVADGLPYSAAQVRPDPSLAAERVTAFIPAYRCEATLERCLQAVRRLTYPVHEVLVVDDGSPDRAAEIAADLGAKVVHHPENRGLAAACNTALDHCAGDYLLKIDADIELSPLWLERAMAAFRDPAVAGVGGKVTEFYTLRLADRWRQTYMAQHWGPQPLAEAPGLFGADCIYRVEALRSVGGWDLRYRTNYEDMNLSLRLRARGRRLVYEPRAGARHLRRDTLESVLNGFWSWYYPPAEDGGGFEGLAAAAGLIGRNRALAHERMQTCLRGGSLDLAYPTFLLYYWLCLRDLEHLGRRGRASPRLVTQTALGVVRSALVTLRGSLAVPPVVSERLERDLAVCVERFTTEDGAPEEADAGYLTAFAREDYLWPFERVHGAVLAHSVAALAADEREAQPPDVVIFNPPTRPEEPTDLALARWRRPSHMEALADQLRSQGRRVLLLDAAAELLDDLDAHERVLGIAPERVIYSTAETDVERAVSSARRLKLLVPDCPQLVLVQAGTRKAEDYPMFDAVFADAPT